MGKKIKLMLLGLMVLPLVSLAQLGAGRQNCIIAGINNKWMFIGENEKDYSIEFISPDSMATLTFYFDKKELCKEIVFIMPRRAAYDYWNHLQNEGLYQCKYDPKSKIQICQKKVKEETEEYVRVITFTDAEFKGNKEYTRISMKDEQ